MQQSTEQYLPKYTACYSNHLSWIVRESILQKTVFQQAFDEHSNLFDFKIFCSIQTKQQANISYFHLFHLSDNGEIRKRNATQFSKLNLLLEVSLSGPNKPWLYISDSEVYILHFFCFKQFNICRLLFLCSNIVSINLRMCHTQKQDTDRISHDFCPDFWHTQESVDSELIGF